MFRTEAVLRPKLRTEPAAVTFSVPKVLVVPVDRDDPDHR